ncbi:hypothetical protein, partial [Klebsiella pneumoniae]|uniref:hypothetical protein n=1 Tax=Klebsiella pneumoniae TaxID=573 RepID=UPI002E2CDCD4
IPQARQAQRRRAMTTGTVLLLCRAAAHALPGIRFVRPAVNLFTIVAETAGADGLKIAETFPEGRGSPHGCGLRAVFCLQKIREIFCVNEEKTDISEGKRMVRKSPNNGQVQMNLSNSTDRSECTGGTGPNEPTTNNNIQITNKKDDDDIPNAS